MAPPRISKGRRVSPVPTDYRALLRPPLQCERGRVVLSLWRGLCVVQPATMAQIASEVAMRHGVTLDAMRGPRRAKRLVWARHEAFWRIYRTERFSFPQIGRFFGDRDHSTVIYGVRRFEERLALEQKQRAIRNTAYGGWKPFVKREAA
jgi:hypothetical protein